MFDLAMQRRQKKATDPPTLNLNSMMDMLSIILVFLLANISAEEQDFVGVLFLDRVELAHQRRQPVALRGRTHLATT